MYVVVDWHWFAVANYLWHALIVPKESETLCAFQTPTEKLHKPAWSLCGTRLLYAGFDGGLAYSQAKLSCSSWFTWFCFPIWRSVTSNQHPIQVPACKTYFMLETSNAGFFSRVSFYFNWNVKSTLVLSNKFATNSAYFLIGCTTYS